MFEGAGSTRRQALDSAKKKAEEIDKRGGVAPGLPAAPTILPTPAPFASVASAYTPEVPMKIEPVTEAYLIRQKKRVGLPKSEGGIIEDTYTQNDFACRLFNFRFADRYIHTITEAELEIFYDELKDGKIDISPIYQADSPHRLKAYEPVRKSTLLTYFRRLNPIFRHAIRLRAINKGCNPLWASLADRGNPETDQTPYTPEELTKLLPLMELKAPELVRPVVGLIAGIRYCEFAIKRVMKDGQAVWCFLTEDDITITPHFDKDGKEIDPPKICVRIRPELAKANKAAGKERYVQLTPFAARYFAKYHGTSHVLVPLRVKPVKKRGGTL